MFEKTKARWHAFYTWCLGGFHIGWDLGQGLLNFLPQSALGLFFEITPNSKLFQLPNLLNKYFLGPLLGAAFAVLALPPAVIEGVIFKRPYKSINNEWATRLVSQQGVKLFWGALGISALWLTALTAGYLTTAISSALSIPLALSYGIVALAGVSNLLKNVYGSMITLYIYRTKEVEWSYTLKSIVNIQLDQAEEVKEPLHNEFIHELAKMSVLYDQAYAQYVQQTHKAPTVTNINELGVLSYYGLQKDQSDFLTKLCKDEKFHSNTSKLAAVEARHQDFDKKYNAIR